MMTACTRFVRSHRGCHVTGIGYSDDKLLQARYPRFCSANLLHAISGASTVRGCSSAPGSPTRRLFVYDDAQRYRIGPNFGLLPVNRPRCPFFNYRQDGAMNFAEQKGEINYYPSSFSTAVRKYLPNDDSALVVRFTRMLHPWPGRHPSFKHLWTGTHAGTRQAVPL